MELGRCLREASPASPVMWRPAESSLCDRISDLFLGLSNILQADYRIGHLADGRMQSIHYLLAMTTSGRDESASFDRDGLGKLGFAVAVAVITTLISSAISSLTKLQPVAVFAAAAGVALLVLTQLAWQKAKRRTGATGKATIGVAVAYSFLWLAAYLLDRAL